LGKTEKVSEDDELYVQDVEDIVYVLERIKKKTKTQNDRQNFIRSASNIVSQKRKNVWKNIPVRCHASILLLKYHTRKAVCDGDLKQRSSI
jgi:hypothetical protein